MNLLTDKTSDELKVGGLFIKIKTDFVPWVKFLIAIEENNDKLVIDVLTDIMGEIPTGIEPKELTTAIMDWLWSTQEKTPNTSKQENNTTSRKSFDFSVDGNVIFCELWEHFPHLMQQGISFQQGIELIKLLVANEKTVMHHRAFARCGDFSKMDKEQRKFWQKERAKYAIKAKQSDIDDVFSSAF